MKLLRIILVSIMLNFSVEVTGAVSATAEGEGLLKMSDGRRASFSLSEAIDIALYYLGVRHWDPLAVVVALPPLPVRDSNATADEQSHANAIFQRAFRLEREGTAEKSNAKIAESVGLFHEASQYGHPQACGVMEVFCRESQHGLTPELLLTYRDRMHWWVTTLKVTIASAGEDGSAAIRPIVVLPDLLSREHYTTPAEREIAHNLVIKAASYEGKDTQEDLKQFLLLLHAAAQYGNPTACNEMRNFCEFSKYGFSPLRASMYDAQKRWWQSPAELAAIATRERARLGIAPEKHSSDGSDSTHRLSAAASGSSSDGVGEASGDTGRSAAAGGAGSDAGLRYRKPASKGAE